MIKIMQDGITVTHGGPPPFASQRVPGPAPLWCVAGGDGVNRLTYGTAETPEFTSSAQAERIADALNVASGIRYCPHCGVPQ